MKYDIRRPVFCFACLLSGCNAHDAIGPVYGKDIPQHASSCADDKRSGDPEFSPAGTPPDSNGSTESSDFSAAPASVPLVGTPPRNEGKKFFDSYQFCQDCSEEGIAAYEAYIRKSCSEHTRGRADKSHIHDSHSVEGGRCRTKFQYPSHKHPYE